MKLNSRLHVNFVKGRVKTLSEWVKTVEKQRKEFRVIKKANEREFEVIKVSFELKEIQLDERLSLLE